MYRGRWGAVPWIVGCVALLLACTSLAAAKVVWQLLNSVFGKKSINRCNGILTHVAQVDEALIRALIANMTLLEKVILQCKSFGSR
jgi:uncharacterized membrane protein YqhA